jgi:dUTP pyrophosphatase
LKQTVTIINEIAKNISYATNHSAGLDLVSTETRVLHKGENYLFGTGITTQMQPDQVALVFARSGLAVKHGIRLRNGTGVIDADYEGEIKVCLQNDDISPFVVEKGERIAQLVLLPFTRFDNVPVKTTERKGGGFGSTG